MISSKMLNESHGLELRRNRLENEEALFTQFQQSQIHPQYRNSNRDINWHRNHNAHSSGSYSARAQVCKGSRGYQRDSSCNNQRKNNWCLVCGSPDHPARLRCNKYMVHKEKSNVNLLTNEDHKISDTTEDIHIALTEISNKIDNNQPWYLNSKATRHETSNKKKV